MSINYHGRIFIGAGNSANGEVSGQTLFVYEQDGRELSGTYAGGAIARGHLIGTVNDDDSLDFVYHHLNADGQTMAGRCHSVPGFAADGRIVLAETWQWLTGDQSAGESVVEEPGPGYPADRAAALSLRECVTEALRSQYSAAFSTLEEAISFFPERYWQRSHEDGPADQVIFHTLFFADVYLGSGFDAVREQAFHRRHPDLFQDYEELANREPANRYPRDLCVQYLEFCRTKAEEHLSSQTERSLLADSGFPGRSLSRLALDLYNIRHIQHHAAQLGLRNQLGGGKPLSWQSR
jgi:hypothetical protein